MKTQNRKILVWSTAVLTLMLVGTACSGANNNDSAESSSPSASTAVSPSASASPEATASPTASASTSEAKTATGEFQGVIDPHSIEIKVDGKTEGFQIDPDTADKVSTWDAGTKVSFQYTETTQDVNGEQVKQLTITAIDKA